MRVKQTPQFNDNEAVKRLEALLKDEENMRREMEKTARNMKMELYFIFMICLSVQNAVTVCLSVCL